jgi:ABC-type amino acid transport substrate-binding protein
MIHLSFTPYQMREFLIKGGNYNIEVIKVTYSYSEYHNVVREEERELEIAHPIDIPLENFTANKTYVQLLDWSLTSVFERELKAKLLNL